MSDELIVFAEEESTDNVVSANQLSTRPWKVLVVDDDRDVHEATKFGLKGLVFLGQPLELLHAYSAEEAAKVISDNDDLAVILLDVVMETESAGLDLIKVIREDLGRRSTRIILRTGQPGYAPEIEVILKYDINDYRNKADLTRTRLYTSVTAAIRSYSEIMALDTSRKGLEKIVRASSELMSLHGIRELASGITIQLSALLGTPEEGMVCIKSSHDKQKGPMADDLSVVATSGASDTEDHQILKDPRIVAMLLEAATKRNSVEHGSDCVLCFPSEFRDDMMLYLDLNRPLEEPEHQLLEIFCSNISVCLDNATILDRLHNYAYFDSLLGIPNRVSFARYIDKIMASEPNEQLICLIDIDHFSGINDTLGTKAGDELLKMVSQRLTRSLPEETFVCRVSGDTFGVMGPLTALSIQTINDIVERPFHLLGDEIAISTTKGFYILHDANIAGNDAIKRANIALKRAKDFIRGDAVEYTHEIERETHQRMLLLQGLRKAHAENELFMVYQPQIDLKTGKIYGLEALVRWRTHSGDMIPPDQFIPVAESSGLIVELGEWIMKTALLDLESLEERYSLKLQVGINISSVQFRHPNFLKSIESALEQSNLERNQVEFEVTESVALMDIDSVRMILNQIHNLGVQVAIDDFGTGFSCLNYLETLQFDRLKIDKSFIDKMVDNGAETHIPEMIINLGRDLNMAVIAEGIETEEQAEKLKKLQCYEAQGYFFGRPMELTDLCSWIDKHIIEH